MAINDVFIVGMGKMGHAVGDAFDHAGFHTFYTNPLDVAKESGGCVILTVKSHDFPELAKELKPRLNRNHFILSLMAGVPIAMIKKELGEETMVARAMPSLGCVTGKSITAFCSPDVPAFHIRKILDMFGKSVEVEEKDFPAITALLGGGPAYVALLADAMTKSGAAMGLGEVLVSSIVAHTFDSTAEILHNMKPESFIESVCSNGGSTERGINYLKSKDFQGQVAEALNQAKARFRA
jgi:pyrroline-5-carboxylate reductase